LETILDSEEDAFIKKFAGFKNIYNNLTSEYNVLPISEFAQRVVEEFGIKFAYQSKEEDFERAMNIDALIASMKEYEDKNPGATLENYLETVCLVSDIDSFEEQNNTVTIATVHAVKGLEFKCVFIVGAEENIFPISRAMNSSSDMEEERRLMYVAITRAEERLFITSCKVRYLYGRNNYMLPSRFLSECRILERENIRSSPVIEPKKYDYSSRYNSIRTNIEEEKEEEKPKKDTSVYQIGQMVLHPKFGIGTINNIDDSAKFADINFKEFGNKTLLLDIAPLKIIKGK
ncbi:MAG: ATP-binding domain-containing protein, partial [Clostridia bacterium]|nr:ATP-binding domain-containing protein [Clostridia bacterium]